MQWRRRDGLEALIWLWLELWLRHPQTLTHVITINYSRIISSFAALMIHTVSSRHLISAWNWMWLKSDGDDSAHVRKSNLKTHFMICKLELVFVRHVYTLNQHCFTYLNCIPATIYANVLFPECFWLSWFESAEFCWCKWYIFKVGMEFNCFITLVKLVMHVNYWTLYSLMNRQNDQFVLEMFGQNESGANPAGVTVRPP